MSIFDRFKKKEKEEKAYTGAAFMYDPTGQEQHTKISYEALAKEGYQDNAIAYRCITMIASSVANTDCDLYEHAADGSKRLVQSHPSLNLLCNPNNQQGKAEFIAELVSFLLISGNAYIFNPNMDEGDPKPKEPKMLYNLRPNDVKVIAGKNNVYAYKLSNMKKEYRVNPVTGLSAIMQIKDFNPMDVFHGQSKLAAARYSIDSFNEAQKWNFNLLKKGAKPSGLLVAKDVLTEEQYNDLVESIAMKWSGASNAGNIPIAHSGLEFKQMSMSPMDMDFKDNQIMAARYIAQCFGVPAQLIGLPEAQTFSNMESAKLAFYEDTVIPLANYIYGALNRWLFQFYKQENLYFSVNLDKVSALDVSRKDKAERFAKLVDTGTVTPNEAREALGFAKSDEVAADKLYISGGKIPLDFVGDIDGEVESDAKAEHEDFQSMIKKDEEINSFQDSKYPERPSYQYIKDIKDNYPEMWREVGNGGEGEDRTSFTGKDAFDRWTAYNDGDRSEDVLNWLKRRESFVARFRNNVSNWEGMLALGMWAGIPSDGGFDKMKRILNEKKKIIREERG